MRVERDILGDLVLSISRGGVGRCVIRHLGFNCEHAIQDKIEELTKIRLRNGYTLVK